MLLFWEPIQIDLWYVASHNQLTIVVIYTFITLMQSVFAESVQAVEDDGVYFIPELNKSYT